MPDRARAKGGKRAPMGKGHVDSAAREQQRQVDAVELPGPEQASLYLHRLNGEQQRQAVVGYQRSLGNAAVQRMLQRARPAPPRQHPLDQQPLEQPPPELAVLDMPELKLDLPSLPAAPTAPDTADRGAAVSVTPPSARVQREDDGDSGGLLGPIKAKLNSLVNGLKGGWQSLTSTAESAFEGLQARAGGIKDTLGGMASSAIDGIQSGWNSVKDSATSVTRDLETRITSGVSSVLHGASAMATAVSNVDGHQLQAAWSNLRGMFGGLTDTVSGLAKSAMGRLGQLWSGLSQRFTGVLGGLGDTAKSLMNGLTSAARGIRDQLASTWNGLQERASQMGGIVGTVASVLKSIVDRLLSVGQQVWGGIQRMWASLRERLNAIAQRVQEAATSAWNAVKAKASSIWDSIGKAWSDVRKWASAKIQGGLGKVGDVWKKFQGLSFDKVVDALVRAAPFIQQLRAALADPASVMQPMVAGIASQLQTETPGKSQQVVQENLQQTGGGGPATATAAPPIQRTVDTSSASSSMIIQRETATATLAPAAPIAADSERSTETFKQLGHGLWESVKAKWEKLSLLGMVWDAIKTLVWPWPAVGHEFGDMWTELKAAVGGLYAVHGLHDFYSNVMKLLDIPLVIGRHLINSAAALSGWATIALMILGAVGGEFAAGVITALTGGAGAPTVLVGGPGGAGVGLGAALQIGRPLFLAFVAAQGAEFLKSLVDLLTVKQTDEEKKAKYSQATDSGLALAIAGVLALLSHIGSEIGSRALPLLRKIPIPADVVPERLKAGVSAFGKGVQEGLGQKIFKADGTPVSDAAMEVFKKAAPDRQQIFGRNPDFLERFAGYAPGDQAFLNGIKTPAFDSFANLTPDVQNKFLTVSQRSYTPPPRPGVPPPAPITFRNNFNALSADRQVGLMTPDEIGAMERTAVMDEKYTNAGGQNNEGHGFGEHGSYRSDAELFQRAKNMGRPVSRYNSSIDQEAFANRFRGVMEDPATPAGDRSAINAKGRKAIANGTTTAQKILADPVNNKQFLKDRVTFKKEPAGRVVGTEFDPDGVTTRDVSNVTVVFELGADGRYRVLTNFPEKL